MVKKIILSLVVFISNVFATSSLDFATSIVGDSSKQSQLELLFTNQAYKDDNGNLDIDKISRVLKTNSLLNLNLANPVNLKLTFKAKADAILFFKIINDALNDAGFVYFIPTDFILRDKNINYSISLESQYLLDPGVFYKLLKANSVYIEDIKRIGTYDYEYDLNFDNAVLKTNVNIALNSPKNLEKPLKDYVFSLKDATNLIIDSSNADNWFPKVLFLDKNLNLIKSVKAQNQSKHLSELVPSGAIYVIVSDMYSLDNIRRGLTITLKK